MPDIISPASIEPPQPPTLAYRVARAIDALRGKFPAPASPDPKPIAAPQTPDNVKSQDDAQGRGFSDANYISAWFRQYQELFLYGVTRQKRYAEYDVMDVSQVAAMLDAVVDACLVSDDGSFSGFKIECKSSKYQTIIDQVNKNLDLTYNIRFILRDTLKYGDNFLAIVMDDNWNIVNYENPPPGQMFVYTDEHLRLLTGTEVVDINGKKIEIPRSYQQKSSAMQTVAGWFAWEMYHLKFFPSRRALYSTKSFIEDMRADWHKLRLMEEALVLTRLTRASPRNVHTLDVTGKSSEEAKSALDEYIRSLTQTKLSNDQYVRDTVSVDQDVFLGNVVRTGQDGKLYPSLNNVQQFDPRVSGLQRLPDIEHFVRKHFARVPSEIVGILPDRNDITSQDIAAGRFYSNCQLMLEKQLLRPIYNLALSLRGYKPDHDDYRIIFPNVQMRSSWRSADARFRDSMASGNDVDNGIISRKYVSQQKYGFSDTEWEDVKKEIKSEMDDMGAIPNATKPALVRKGQNSESEESTDNPILEQAKQQYAESMLPILQELRELKEQVTALKSQPPPQPSNVTVNVPERPININVPEQRVEVHPAQVTVEPAQLNFTLPEQQAPVVNVAPSHVSVTVPEQSPPQVTIEPAQVNVTVPEQPAPIVHNTLNIPEQSAQVTVNVPEQPAPIVNIAPSQVSVNVPEQPTPIVQNTVNLPEQQAPTINVSPTPITVNPALVSVNVPEMPAPVIVNEVNLPEPVVPQVTVNVPEQQSPVINVAPAEVKIENVIPEQPTPQVNVTLPEQVVPTVNVNVPQDAIKVDVSVDARVDLPDEEIVEFTREPATGKVVGAKKTRKYTRRKKKVELEQTEAPNTDSPIDNSTDSSQNS